MKLAEHEIILNGSLKAAWSKLVDWRSMPQWDHLMASLNFDGPLKEGSTGELILKNGAKYTLKVTSFHEENDYTDEFSTLGSRLIFYHELKPLTDTTIKMRFVIEGDGLLLWLFQIAIRWDLRTKLPALMNTFKEQFERP
ncbi:MAG: SRPBCC family protein [Candidatus Obscuribacterales bacterium]|nr:SRPBCC family protein [Candidatus Obscuribacterales bacterium]